MKKSDVICAGWIIGGEYRLRCCGCNNSTSSPPLSRGRSRCLPEVSDRKWRHLITWRRRGRMTDIVSSTTQLSLWPVSFCIRSSAASVWPATAWRLLFYEVASWAEWWAPSSPLWLSRTASNSSTIFSISLLFFCCASNRLTATWRSTLSTRTHTWLPRQPNDAPAWR